MLRLRTFAVCAIASFVAACGGGSSVPVTDLDTSLTDAYCQYLVRCGVVESTARCKQELGTGGFDTAAIEGGVGAGKITYDADAAGDCVDAYANLSCNPGDKGNRVTPQACTDAIKGTVADGGACAISAECVSQSCNVPACDQACCPGTCNPTIAEVAIGGSCASAPCVDGSYCATATKVCTALVASGGTCAASRECAFGTTCIDTKCQKPAGKGEACIVTTDGGTCGTTGVFCNQTTMKCEGYLFSGATCDPAADACAGYLICDETTMKCGDYPSVGEACTFSCKTGAFCDTATSMCVATKADGTTCQFDDECTSNNCDTTTLKCTTPMVCF
ncbi:MAG: hypothetical protein K8W52_00090 [Deltaproteobacteria bacterium]|nr:hypothetical protein [Deltaproteobacteria bacterium]